MSCLASRLCSRMIYRSVSIVHTLSRGSSRRQDQQAQENDEWRHVVADDASSDPISCHKCQYPRALQKSDVKAVCSVPVRSPPVGSCAVGNAVC